MLDEYGFFIFSITTKYVKMKMEYNVKWIIVYSFARTDAEKEDISYDRYLV